MLHLPHFNKDVMGMHSWRQAQTQTNVLNFATEDSNILHPRRNDRGTGEGIFRMEFPLQQWLASRVQLLLGNSPFVMRSFLFSLSLLTIAGLFFWLREMIKAPVMAAIAAGAFAFAPTFFYHSFNPMPDNLALCAGIWGLAFTEIAVARPKKSQLAWVAAAVLLAVATLCKLPFVLYYSVPAGYLLVRLQQRRPILETLQPAGLILAGFLAPTIWYATVLPEWQGNNIVGGILSVDYSWARLFDYFQHNLISTLPELLLNFGAVPAFFYALYELSWRNRRSFAQHPPYLLLGVSLLAFFFYELHALGKAHDYYLYPYLPILFLFVTYGIRQWWKRFAERPLRYLLPVLLILTPLFCSLRLAKAWEPEAPGFNSDLYANRQELREIVPDSTLVIVAVDRSPFIYLYHLRKKGWVLHQHQVAPKDFNQMLEGGAQFLYSDSRKLESQTYIKAAIEEELFSRGSFRVFRLKETSD